MNLQTHIREDLWQAIEKSYQVENYSHAITDAMQFLTDILRDKVDYDGDGVKLVNYALGGEEPKIRINNFQTLSEKDEQKGVQQIIFGMYLAIRNPRNHENSQKIEDSRETADAIICFINHLIELIDASKSQYSISDFIALVSDEAFVKSSKYAKLLVDQIPEGKLLDTLIELYRMREDLYSQNLDHVLREMFPRLRTNHLDQFANVISEDLLRNPGIYSIIRFINSKPEIWNKLPEITKIRAENILIESVKEGKADQNSIYEGVLGTWSTSHWEYFERENQQVLSSHILHVLKSENEYEIAYVKRFLIDYLHKILKLNYHKSLFIQILKNDFKNGQTLRGTILSQIKNFELSYQKEVARALEEYTNPNQPALRLEDGTPFLEDLFIPPGNVDDIPF